MVVDALGLGLRLHEGEQPLKAEPGNSRLHKHVQKNIAGFDVAVNELLGAALVNVGNPLRCSSRDAQSLGPRERSLR